MKFKVVRGFVSQVLHEIENNLFAIRLIIDRIAEFQGSQQNLVKSLKLITELQLSHPHYFGRGRGMNDVDYVSKKWKIILVNDRIKHSSNGKGRSPAVRHEEHATEY